MNQEEQSQYQFKHINPDDLEGFVTKHFNLAPTNIFPVGLFSNQTVQVTTKNKGTQSVPLFQLALRNYPLNEPAHMFQQTAGKDMDEDSDEYYQAREEYMTDRIVLLIAHLNELQIYGQRVLHAIKSTLHNHQKEQTEPGTLMYEVNLMYPKIRNRLNSAQLILAKIISSYIASFYEDGDGTMSVKLSALNPLLIETKLSKQNVAEFSKFSEMLEMMGMMGIKNNPKMQQLKNSNKASNQPKPSEYTSPLSAFCPEIDSKRGLLTATYATSPSCRNIVEARCEKLEDIGTDYLTNASLKGDIYMVVEENRRDYSLRVSAINNAGNAGGVVYSFDNVDGACIDAARQSILVSTKNKIISHKVNIEHEKVKSLTNEFVIEAPKGAQFGSTVCYESLLFCADYEQPFYYTYRTTDQTLIGKSRIPVLDANCSASDIYVNPFNGTLMIIANSLVYTQNTYGNSPCLLGFGNNVTDLAFEKNLIAAASADDFVHIFDTRVKFTAMAKLEGHGDQLSTCEIANINGTPFVWSGGLDQCVRCWDLRMQVPLYELSTGNNTVLALDWHEQSSTLFCATNHVHDASSFDEEEEYEEDSWPRSAQHPNGHFTQYYHSTCSTVMRYQYKDVVESNKPKSK